MVIAEMIATGDLARLTRPGLELDLSRPVSFTGNSFNDGIGLGHVVLHEPRIVVTNLFNEDSEEEVRRLEASLDSLRLSIDRRGSASTARSAPGRLEPPSLRFTQSPRDSGTRM